MGAGYYKPKIYNQGSALSKRLVAMGDCRIVSTILTPLCGYPLQGAVRWLSGVEAPGIPPIYHIVTAMRL